MKQIFKNLFGYFIFFPFAFICLLITFILWLCSFFVKQNKKPRLVWGCTPIINNSHWSRAMREFGYSSETLTFGYYDRINSREDWDLLIDEKFFLLPKPFRAYVAFIFCLFYYDVFFISVDGFSLGNTPLWRLESPLLKLANKKVVVSPYGGDSYVYRRIRSTTLVHGLLMSYPDASKKQNQLSEKLDYWSSHADFVMPGVMGIDGFGRWDVLFPSALSLNLEVWRQSPRLSEANGSTSATVKIAHAPNHRGFKGTEFVLATIQELKNEGYNIELVLLENLQNSEVKSILENDIDILIEQLICTGHGLNAIEGMACGLPVISNLEDDDYLLPMRRWSYFSECPLVSASPENLTDVLRKLVKTPSLRHEIGNASRKYVEKYQGTDSSQYLFNEIIEYTYGRRESLINLYHPLLSEHSKRSPKIDHPLINNQLPN